MRMTLFIMRWIVCCVAMLVSSALAEAQNPDYILEVNDWSGQTGASIEAPVLLSNFGGNIQGWSFGICHDPAVLQLDMVESGLTTQIVNGGSPPDFYTVNTLPGGFTVGVVISSHFGTGFLFPGVDFEMEVPHYTVIGDPTGATICPCSQTLGSPAVFNGVVVGGATISPVEICGDNVPPEFVRGDCNGDGSIDIGDAIFVEQYLFLSGTEPPCHSGCDTNDDGLLNIADSIYLLNALFVGGPEPSAPYPACGRDLTDDSLSCEDGCL